MSELNCDETYNLDGILKQLFVDDSGDEYMTCLTQAESIFNLLKKSVVQYDDGTYAILGNKI